MKPPATPEPAASTPAASASARSFLEAWHEATRTRSLAPLLPLVSEAVTLSSPALMKPKLGRDEVTALLRDVIASLQEYQVTRTWAEGRELLLEFEAKVGDRLLRGIDRITLDEEGRLAHLEVFVRPFKGLLALMRSVLELQLERLPLHRRLLARAHVALKTRRR